MAPCPALPRSASRGGALLPAALAAAFSSAACRPPVATPPAPLSAATPPAAPVQPAAVPAAAERIVRMVLTTRMGGTTEPCGCTSEPLGDVSRLLGLLNDKAGTRALLLDAGGLRYGLDPMDDARLGEARLKSEFLEEMFASLGAIVMLQPEDLRGPDGPRELAGRRRLVTNASGLPEGATVPEVLRSVAGVRIGVLGVANPEGAWPKGITIVDPVVATRAGVARLRAAGAEVIVVLTGLPRDRARGLARRVAGLDLVVVGADSNLEAGIEEPESVGGAVLVVPGTKGERVVRVELHLPLSSALAPVAAGPLTLRRSPEQERRFLAQSEQKLAAAETRLAALRKDPEADAAFVRTTAAEVQKLRETVAATRAPAPAATNAPAGFLTAELVPITRSLPRDAQVSRAMSELDRRIGEANLRALAGPPPVLPPPPPAGRPHYLGDGGCLGACHYHDDAVEFWKKTRHAQAWQTLVDAKKDLALACVRCHAVGFDELGGSNLWTLAQWQQATQQATQPKPQFADLRSVNCEVCHGPGSQHVLSPSKVPVPIPRPTEDRCLTCHTRDHSDTFSHKPYLRDILGPGHGEEQRKALGDGPTGHTLRQAALAKAAAAH